MLIPLIVKDLIYGFDRAPMAVMVSFLLLLLLGFEDGGSCGFKSMLILSKIGLYKKYVSESVSNNNNNKDGIDSYDPTTYSPDTGLTG